MDWFKVLHAGCEAWNERKERAAGVKVVQVAGRTESAWWNRSIDELFVETVMVVDRAHVGRARARRADNMVNDEGR